METLCLKLLVLTIERSLFIKPPNLYQMSVVTKDFPFIQLKMLHSNYDLVWQKAVELYVLCFICKIYIYAVKEAKKLSDFSPSFGFVDKLPLYTMLSFLECPKIDKPPWGINRAFTVAIRKGASTSNGTKRKLLA